MFCLCGSVGLETLGDFPQWVRQDINLSHRPSCFAVETDRHNLYNYLVSYISATLWSVPRSSDIPGPLIDQSYDSQTTGDDSQEIITGQ